MAPEQVEGKHVDPRTDIFVFGVVLYELVTGKKAFEGKSHVSLLAAILGSEPTPMSVLQKLTPPALEHLVSGCLAKAPDDRWESATTSSGNCVGFWKHVPMPSRSREGRQARDAANASWPRLRPPPILAAVVLGLMFFREHRSTEATTLGVRSPAPRAIRNSSNTYTSSRRTTDSVLGARRLW